MSALPPSPRIAAAEQLCTTLKAVTATHNGGTDPDIVQRAWDDNLANQIDLKLGKLGICVLVCAPRRKPLQERGGRTGALLTTQVIIESNPVLKATNANTVLGWDADDLADAFAAAINASGHAEINHLRPRVTNIESSRVQFTNKSVTLTIEQIAIIK